MGTGPAYGGPMTFQPTGRYEPGDLAPAAAPRHPEKLITVGAGFGTNSAGALRLELDLLERGHWTIGVVAGLTASAMPVDASYDPYTQLSTSNFAHANIVDYTAAATLGHISRWGDWHLRAGTGVGVMLSSMTLDQYDYSTGSFAHGTGSDATPYVEAALFLGHSLGTTNTWELEAGPVVSYSKQAWYLADSMQTMYRDAGTALVIVGLRHGL